MKQVKGIDSRGYCLYELTERDLTFLVDHDYRVGNILIFSSSVKARLGKEIGRANNIKAAEEFLASLPRKGVSFPLEEEVQSAENRPLSFVEEVRPADNRRPIHTPTTDPDDASNAIQLLPETPSVGSASSLESREFIDRQPRAGLPRVGLPEAGSPDTGLPDAVSPDAGLPSDPASILRESERVLTELAEKHEELRKNDARRYEVRIEGLTRENEELQRSISEKSKRIDELSFISLQSDIQREELINDLREASNSSAVKAVEELDELRVKVIELETELAFEKNKSANLEDSAVLLSAEKSLLEHELKAAQESRAAQESKAAQHSLPGLPETGSFKTASENERELVLTNSSGGVIHIYHEFPPVPKRSTRKRLFSQARRIAFILIVLVAVAYIFYLNSVLDTMRMSGIDISSYSDAVLSRIRELFGF